MISYILATALFLGLTPAFDIPAGAAGTGAVTITKNPKNWRVVENLDYSTLFFTEKTAKLYKHSASETNCADLILGSTLIQTHGGEETNCSENDVYAQFTIDKSADIYIAARAERWGWENPMPLSDTYLPWLRTGTTASFGGYEQVMLDENTPAVIHLTTAMKYHLYKKRVEVPEGQNVTVSLGGAAKSSESMYAAHAALVPELLSRLPYQVFAASSLDALVHAAESLLSPNATDFTRLLSREAIVLILNGYLKMRDEGLQARLPLLKDFLLASTLAGLAFGTAGCAAVHALSYPLGGTFHVPHGESNYALFTQVLKSYRSIRVEGSLAGLLELLSRILGCSPERALDELETLLAVILPLKPLREYGMTEQHVPEFARNVLATQQRLLKNNFTPLSEEEIAAIYRARL